MGVLDHRTIKVIKVRKQSIILEVSYLGYYR